MELNYTIRGADGMEYGPATLEQLSGWIREGRINRDSELKRSDMQHWSAAANFSELQPLLAPAVATPPPPLSSTPAATPGGDAATVARLKSGASWFYWIAGLSLINSIAAAMGGDFQFLFGLGVTQVLDQVGAQFGGGAKFIALGLNVGVAAIFILFGVFAHKRHQWAFIVGMALFGLDGLLMLVAQAWIGVAFHAFVLFCLFVGWKACRSLNSN